MVRLKRHLEVALVVFMLLVGSAFLLKMCYLSLSVNTAFGVFFLVSTYAYLRFAYQIAVPPSLLILVLFALEVDALGNYFRLYGQQFGPMQYDEFAHVTVQALITPFVVWLMLRLMLKYDFPLPLSIASLFSGSLMFGVAAAYEIIELWDELYFGGKRIWGPYDTAMDLQWDLCGIVLGVLLANAVLRLPARQKFLQSW